MAPAPGDVGGSPKKALSASAADAAAAAAAAIAAARVGAWDQLQRKAVDVVAQREEQRVIARRGCGARGGGTGKNEEHDCRKAGIFRDRDLRGLVISESIRWSMSWLRC